MHCQREVASRCALGLKFEANHGASSNQVTTRATLATATTTSRVRRLPTTSFVSWVSGTGFAGLRPATGQQAPLRLRNKVLASHAIARCNKIVIVNITWLIHSTKSSPRNSKSPTTTATWTRPRSNAACSAAKSKDLKRESPRGTFLRAIDEKQISTVRIDNADHVSIEQWGRSVRCDSVAVVNDQTTHVPKATIVNAISHSISIRRCIAAAILSRRRSHQAMAGMHREMTPSGITNKGRS